MPRHSRSQLNEVAGEAATAAMRLLPLDRDQADALGPRPWAPAATTLVLLATALIAAPTAPSGAARVERLFYQTGVSTRRTCHWARDAARCRNAATAAKRTRSFRFTGTPLQGPRISCCSCGKRARRRIAAVSAPVIEKRKRRALYGPKAAAVRKATHSKCAGVSQ